MKNIVYGLCIMVWIMACNTDRKKIVENFLTSLNDETIPIEKIIADFIDEDVQENKTIDSILQFQMNSVRGFLHSCTKPYEIYTYEEAKTKNIDGFFEIYGDDLVDIYILKCNNELLPFKVSKNNRIGSFSIVKKGNKSYLLKYK